MLERLAHLVDIGRAVHDVPEALALNPPPLLKHHECIEFAVRGRDESEHEAPKHTGANDDGERGPRSGRKQVLRLKRGVKRDHNWAHDADKHVKCEPGINGRGAFESLPSLSKHIDEVRHHKQCRNNSDAMPPNTCGSKEFVHLVGFACVRR